MKITPHELAIREIFFQSIIFVSASEVNESRFENSLAIIIKDFYVK